MRKNGIVNKYEYVKEKITMDNKEKALLCHKEWNGKLETVAKSKVKTREDLAIAYTPGVAEPCKVIAEDKTAAYTYTWKANTVAVVSDGSAVLGLGNIGPYAAMPVMEGKCVLFKEFGNVNAVPICLDTQDTEEIIQAVKNIAPGFGGINLEDISAPRCFEIEERLKEMLDIPVFHDDQHGTAIVVLAGIINGLRVTGKKKEDCRVVVNGAGSAGVAITKLLLTYGFKHVTMCDREGIIGKDYPNLNWMQKKMTEVTNLENASGTLADALRGADIFVGHSGNGFFHEQRCHPVCHGKSGTGDHAGCGQSCRSKSCRNRTERFPKSGKQRDRFPWYFPRCIGGTCHPDHRRNETCSSRSTCSPSF